MMSINTAPHHVPQRTCVACGRTDAKRGLVRLVRVAGGGVEIDTTGRKNGRGAYLCATRACWESGLKKDRLEHALRTSLTPANKEQLMKYGLGLEEGAA